MIVLVIESGWSEGEVVEVGVKLPLRGLHASRLSIPELSLQHESFASGLDGG